jgi:hypothetical protein
MARSSTRTPRRPRPNFEMFEQGLAACLDGWGAAPLNDDADLASAAREALRRLKEEPGLRVLAEPKGPGFYEDPILDSAWMCMQSTAEGKIGFAAEGEDLDTKLAHWITFALPFVRGRFARTRDILENRLPTRDIQLGSEARLAIFGDGGYSGLAQRRVLGMIEGRHKGATYDAVIHLGDTYHAGSEAEMFRHLVVPLAELRQRLELEIFSLCGNHDLYAGPDAYLGALSIFGQPGRFFAIETPSWRIACLDSCTGDTSSLCMNGNIDHAQLDWLTRKQADRKKLILLTHHAPLSAWYSPPGALLDQLRALPGLAAWYWGHEHRCAAYRSVGNTRVLGGCVGNGAFLERFQPPIKERGGWLAWYPLRGRCNCFSTRGTRYWPHGYLELAISADGAAELFFVEGETAPASTRNLP